MTFSDIVRAFGYTLSLPERLVRSLAAALGGVSKLLTDTLVPEPLRKSTAYTAIVGNTQRFVIEKVAEVQGAYPADQQAALPERFIARAAAGNAINAAGLFAVHLSPMWAFAFISDIANGSKVYLNRLVKEMKEGGVIAPETEIKQIDDLLEALGKAGKDTAQVFDLPPVDVDSLHKLRADLTNGYANVFKCSTGLLPRVDNLWEKIESVARRDGVAVESVVGLMTLDLEKTAGRAVGAAFAVGNATADMLSETIFQSYGETLSRIQQQGAIECLEEASQPFLDAIGAQMSSGKQTWTEWALGKLMSPFAGMGATELTLSDSAPPVMPSHPSASSSGARADLRTESPESSG